jgi:hypothetical protein
LQRKKRTAGNLATMAESNQRVKNLVVIRSYSAREIAKKTSGHEILKNFMKDATQGMAR